MKITYFFPVFRDNNAKVFFDEFLKSDFYLSHDTQDIVCVVNATDKENVDYLKDISAKEPIFKVFLSEKDFSFNSAFKSSLDYFEGDVVLLGDLKVPKIQLLFEKCLQKHQKGAKIVHVSKHYGKVKGFFVSIWRAVYKMFSRFFTGKTDAYNIESLGLLDKDFVELIKELPHKCCFLKNTKDHYEISSGNIVVDGKVPHHKTELKKSTLAIKTCMVCSLLFATNLLLLLLLNLTIEGLFMTNILIALLEILLAIMIIVTIPKHFFDCRNIVYERESITLDLLKQEKKVRAPQNDKNAQNKQKSGKKSSKIGKNEQITAVSAENASKKTTKKSSPKEPLKTEKINVKKATVQLKEKSKNSQAKTQKASKPIKNKTTKK